MIIESCVSSSFFLIKSLPYYFDVYPQGLSDSKFIEVYETVEKRLLSCVDVPVVTKTTVAFLLIASLMALMHPALASPLLFNMYSALSNTTYFCAPS